MHKRLLAVVLSVPLIAGVLAGPVAAAEGGGSWVVSLGDSYISGEAGRWAGSSNDSETAADALGETAYFDDPEGTGELIPGCHRSRSAQIHIGRGVQSLNLACSGGATASYTTSDGDFKPGLDFYDDGAGRRGQAAMLADFAAANDVDMVVVSIGGNDFDFAGIVEQCVVNFLTSPFWDPNYCSDDADVLERFTPENLALVRAAIAQGLDNVRQAMITAGYADDEWTLVVQTYPSPVPHGADFRYPEIGFDRQTVGGCGFWDEDADWANDTALRLINKTVKQAAKSSAVRRVRVLDLAHAFDGRRLCEDTVGLYEEVGLSSWTDPGAVDRTEWINQIRILAEPPYQFQEAIHPNYWAQLATRSCVRKVYDGGDVRGGTCTIKSTGLKAGEPRMKLR